MVTVEVSANTGPARNGTVTIAGHTYQISQAAGMSSCTYEISSSSGSFTSNPGNTSVSVTTSSPNCSWTTENNLSWVTLAPTSGEGDGKITIQITANTGAARSGTITIAGHSYHITQSSGQVQEGDGLSWQTAWNLAKDEKRTFTKDTDPPRYLNLPLQSGEGVTISLTARVDSGSMDYYVYAPDSNSSFQHVYNIYDEQSRTVSFTARQSGTYKIKVTGSTGIAEIAVYKAFFNPGTKDSDRDFYRTKYTSSYLTSGSYDKNPYDRWFRFEGKKGDEIELELTAHLNSGSMDYYVYAPDSDSSFQHVYNIYDEQSRTVSFTAQTTGTYYVKVTGSRGWFDMKLRGTE